MSRELDTMSEDEFIAGWRRLVGEPPAIMLEDRREMIACLVQSARLTDEPETSGERGRP